MLFYYKAKKISGEEIEGTKEAADEYELAKILKQDDYILVYFKEGGGQKKTLSDFLNLIFPFLNFINRVSVSEKMFFSRNLSVMISAGVSLSRGLETLAHQTQNKKFQTILKNIAEEIKKGKTFSEGLAEYPKIFPPFFSAMIKAGEKTGKLDESLKILGIQLQNDYDLRKKVRGALMYPAVIITAMAAIGILMMIYVVPTLISTFEELKIELPMSTKIIIGASKFFLERGLLAALLFIIFIGIVFYLFSKPKTKRVFSFLALHSPLLSSLVIKINAARTARALSSLISAGIDILEALEISGEVVQNHYYKEILKEAKEKVQKGESMSKIFAAYSNFYPAVFSEMTAVGEETGKLADMLMRVAVFYEDEVSAVTKNFSAIIEPIIMVLVGIIVGFFAVSMIKPMYSMMEGI